MNLTKLSMANPAAVVVVVVLLLILGAVSLSRLPIQLLPNIDQPTINVWTGWRSAAPADMESVIIEQQERVLRNIPGVERTQSGIRQGNGNVLMTFAVGTDMQRAYLDVINRLQQVPALPRDVDGPWVNLGGDNFSGGNAASLLVRSINADDARDPADFQQVISDEVEPRLSRISGVANVNLRSWRPEEVRITLNAQRAAALGIQINEIVQAVSGAADISGGFADVGRRQYTVRFLGKAPLESLGQLIVAQRGGQPVYLSEIARVDVQRIEQNGFTLRNGYPAYYITLSQETGSNTVAILDEVNQAIDELNDGPLQADGLAIELSYDASVHIRRAISLVQGNLLLGGLLATLVLFAFLRNWRATLIVGMSIPICLFTAFVTLEIFGRSLNVISLAGLAFAVGLVLDAAIIVQENIVRLRQLGETGTAAAIRAVREVSPALFASTATSVAIFVPILFMGGAEGQLFSDLALALSIAVIVSLIAALTVIPVASEHLAGQAGAHDALASFWDKLTAGVMRATNGRLVRMAWILVLTVGLGALAWSLLPKADYLPRAKTDNVWANFSMPPGATTTALRADVADVAVERLKPYMSGEKQPKIAYYNLSAWGQWAGSAIYPEDPKQADALMDAMRSDIFQGLPDTQAFVSQGSLLNFSGGGARQIDMDLHGPDLDKLLDAAAAGMGKIREVLPGVPVRPRPGLEMAEPELLVRPDDYRIGQVGLTRNAVGNAVRAYTDGIFVGEYFDGNQRMNVILRGEEWTTPEQLAATPIATPAGGQQRLGDLATLERTVGPSELRRIDGQRTVTLRIFPPEEVTLEEAIDTLKSEVEPSVRAVLGTDGSVRYRGSADGLEAALKSMGSNLVYALLILLLILTALYRSLWDAVLVLSVMPMAFGGGVLALWLLNQVTYQSMDLLTMSGFVILLGLVVNNAILLVDRTRAAERDGHSRTDAVRDAVRQRARPIFMSSLTSLFGMLPLMLVPGTGSEIYRGLATIIVGGMAVSLIFTLLLLPSALRMGESRRLGSAAQLRAAQA